MDKYEYYNVLNELIYVFNYYNNNNDDNNKNDNNESVGDDDNIDLILGICIPGITIFIGVVVVICMMIKIKISSRNNFDESNDEDDDNKDYNLNKDTESNNKNKNSNDCEQNYLHMEDINNITPNNNVTKGNLCINDVEGSFCSGYEHVAGDCSGLKWHKF